MKVVTPNIAEAKSWSTFHCEWRINNYNLIKIDNWMETSMGFIGF